MTTMRAISRAGWVLAAWTIGGAAAWAQPQDVPPPPLPAASAASAPMKSEAELRTDIAKQRRVLQQQLAEQEANCRGQFVVTPCLERVRLQNNAQMRVLRDQEISMDEMHRRERAEAQEQRIADNQREIRERDAAAAERQASAPADAASAGSRGKKPKSLPTPKPSQIGSKATGNHETPSAAERQAEEQRQRTLYDERQREIESHRAAVEKRNAAKSEKKTARPLPWPPAPAASTPASASN